MYSTSSVPSLTRLRRDAHRAALGVPFWDVLQASERTAAFYGQLRRSGVERDAAEHRALTHFVFELLSADELSGVRLSLTALRERKGAGPS